MAILSVDPIPLSQSNETTVEGVTYTVTYQVISDSLDDQTVAIMQSNLFPNLGSLYNEGPTEYDGNAVLTSISITRASDESRLVWHATLKYETREGSWPSGGTVNVNVNDPLTWRDEIEIGFSQYSRPAEAAHYISGFTGKMAIAYPDDLETVDNPLALIVPMNSAAEVFDPPVEYEECILNIKITKNLAFFPTDVTLLYQNTVNSDDFVIDKPDYGFYMPVRKYQAKINNITGSFNFEQNVKFWKVTVNVDIKADGWRVHVLDRGLHSRACEGDPVEPANPDNQEVIESGQERVPKKRLLDLDGIPIGDPALLDGDGAPLDCAAIKAHAFVWITYALYWERPFSIITW